MKNLRTYFEIAFDNAEISDDELKKFSEDHLRRLAANDAGSEFGALLSATNALHTGFFGAISDEDTHAAVRQGLTKSMNGALEAFISAASRREGTIRGEWGKDSAQYQEFFPHGLTEYHRATLETAETLMDRMVTASGAHGDVFPALLPQFTALRSAFLTARGGQLDKKGAVAGSKSEAAAARSALEKQLMTNVLTLALHFLGDPDKAGVYFDQSILHEKQKAAPVPATPSN